MSDGDGVKVAVRVRPFNQRELDRKANLIIKMNGNQTSITNPEPNGDGPKSFTFDYSYWSHDGFENNKDGSTEAKSGSPYAGQRKVYDDLGQGVLNNAFQGYNCSLFAYGQTGSGKSYSMVGYGINRGIVPITCDELFKSISSNKDENKRFEVTFSMLEIYNEQVRDLLCKDNPKGGLQVRQNPKLGLFYVQGLKSVPVGSYREIERRMEQGTASRTVASTNMNATSSRAHTVVTITFDQIIKSGGSETKKSSVMNLVDLAGSERAGSTGATGDRLKEGANINKSLSALGNVISALASEKKKAIIPYRDSVLTKLLQNALGGNSKTIMIAALSPADINYDETLSTLRYADRAKRIKNKAVINENPMEKLIRELRLENERLKTLSTGGPSVEVKQGMSKDDIDKMRRQMEEQIRADLLANQAAIAATEQNWDQKLQEARAEASSIAGNDTEKRTSLAHLMNLNEDPLLSGVVFHYITASSIRVGRKDANPQPEICLNGLSIMKQHAVITTTDNEYEIRPAVQGAKTKVNGKPLAGTTILRHKDRVLFGSNHMYVFLNPLRAESPADLPPEITFEFAQKEIAQAKGFSTGASDLTKDQQIAQEEVLEILPMVSEVNAISEELNKQRSFEVVLISAAAQEGQYGNTNKTKVMVKMKNLLNDNTWLWERAKFMNRRYLVQDMYQRYLDGDESAVHMPQDEDPFWEPNEDVLIGTSNVFLQSLAYALDFDDTLAVTDYKGQEEGSIYVSVAPCVATGKPLEEDYFVDNPSELIGKPYYFKVTVRSAEVTKARFSKGLRIRYRVYKETEYTETKLISGTLSPEFNHSRIVSFPAVTKEHLEFFESGCVTFSLYGIQEDAGNTRLTKMTTKELRQMDHMTPPSGGKDLPRRRFSIDASETSQLKAELLLLTKRFERLESKERRMVDVCNEWAAKPADQQQFAPFHRQMMAIANSSGTKLRTRVQILNKVLRGYRLLKSMGMSKVVEGSAEGQDEVLRGHKFIQGSVRLTPTPELQEKPDDKHSSHNNHKHSEGDTVSIYVFGEEETSLETLANKNGGVINYSHLTSVYGGGAPHILNGKHAANGGTSTGKSPTPTSSQGQPARAEVKNGKGQGQSGSKACVIQ